MSKDLTLRSLHLLGEQPLVEPSVQTSPASLDTFAGPVRVA